MTLTITATGSDGLSTTIQATVLVQDSQLKVQITAPAFDQQMQGVATVTAQVQPDPRFALQGVVLNINPYMPLADAQRDAPLMAVLGLEAWIVGHCGQGGH